MGKLTVITTVDKKTEVTELIEELKKESLKKIDDGTDEGDALSVVASIIHQWILQSLLMSSEDGTGSDGTIN